MTPDPQRLQPRPRLAILSFSSGEYDARSFRIARSAIDAGYDVTLYTRWHAGQAPVEQRDGYRLVRAPFDWRFTVPGLRAGARRRARLAMDEAARAADHPATEGDTVDDLGEPGRVRSFPVRLVTYPFRLVRRTYRRWRRIAMIFPLRPLGWAVALDDVVEPADVWHGMWAGSLPALLRMRARHGGVAIYDSRDVYMLSRDFATLGSPMRPFLAALERRWARAVDRVLTVNESYADLIVQQLGVRRPPVVINCPERWTPPSPVPDRIRAALGLPASTFVVLYQGQLVSERGIEQAMDAIRQVPGAVLVLLGYGGLERRYRRAAASPLFEGKVFVLPAVPPDELLAWSASADLMLMAIQPTTTNHQFTTPQKLWEAIAAGIPVVASDLPGMASIVTSTGVGVLVDPVDPASIAAGIRDVLSRSDAERVELRRHVLAVAHERYNWEAQVGTLFGLYHDLAPDRTPDAAQVTSALAIAAAAAARRATPGPESSPAPLLVKPVVPDGPRLRFVAAAPLTAERTPGITSVVLDTTWTAPRGAMPAGVVLLRDVVERIMRERDVFAEAAIALDGWASSAGIADLMAAGGVSYWYGARLGHWMWVLDNVVWLAVVEQLLAEHPGTVALELDTGIEPGLADAARRIAARDGLAVVDRADKDRPSSIAAGAPAAASAPGTTPTPSRPRHMGVRARFRWRFRPPEGERRRRVVLSRLDRLARTPGRLLVVQAHARQRIDSPTGPRLVNVYLAPVIDELRASRLSPFEVDINAPMADDATFASLESPERAEGLPAEAGHLAAPDLDLRPFRAAATDLGERIAATTAPMPVSGVDLGPVLAARVGERVRHTHARRLADTARITALLRRVRPAGVLLADEYHRQDWLAAAAAEGVAVAAIQHGVIYRWHNGYMHRERPASLRLPGRTYVFGPWERALLTDVSVYRDDEVRVGGSPRLDLVTPAEVGDADRDRIRTRLGVRDGDRMVVLSGTWGPMYRRFHYPIALTRLFAEPADGVHIVVKLHPSERDEGPYRRIIEGAAAAGGFTPPPITIVQDEDLYALLEAADAHLGIHSTVLTEAVATGTPNLIAVGLAAADLLGYVAAGVAIPVETTADLLAALARPRGTAMREADRQAFLAAHFEPGNASRRIADDLLAWLP